MTLSRLIRIARHRLQALFRKEAVDDDLSRELAFHLELLTREYVEEGMAPEDARHAARRALGNVPLLEEQCRDHRRVAWWHDLRQDLHYAIRMMRKQRGFTAVAAVSLALGIGATAAILGVMDALLHRDLPIPHIDRLVTIRTPLGPPGQLPNPSLAEYVAWSERSRAFDAIGVAMGGRRELRVEDDGGPAEWVTGQLFSPEMFVVLGIQPQLGRVFTWHDSGNPGLVLSHGFWLRRFGGDPGVLGRRVQVNGTAMPIVGVMPPEFRYPMADAEYWAPLFARQPNASRNTERLYFVAARLRPDVSLAQAQADVDRVAAQLAEEMPGRQTGQGARVLPLRQWWYGWPTESLLTLQAAVAVVLLIACANVAGLLLARNGARRQEIATRIALGAGWTRIARQLLTETCLLALLGGLLGLLVAWGSVRALVAVSPPLGRPRIDVIDPSMTIVLVTVLLSIATGIAVGLAPAFASRRLESSAQAAASLYPHRWRELLVTGQIALALILLITFALLANSFVRLTGRELGVDTSGVVSFDFRIPPQEFLRGLERVNETPQFEIDSSAAPRIERIYDRLRQLPGIDAVGGISYPLINSIILPEVGVSIPSQRDDVASKQGLQRAVYFLVTPQFFTTVRATFVAGRDISAEDDQNSPWVAVINETLARRLSPAGSAIGKFATLDAGPLEQARQIVGVVRDIPVRQALREPEPVIYVSYLQQPLRHVFADAAMFGQMTFMLRTRQDAAAVIAAARGAVAELEPGRPAVTVSAGSPFVETGTRRSYLLVMGVFAGVAWCLALLGVYGVVSYAAAQRKRDIGIRMTLGAKRADIFALLGTRILALVACGMLIGLAGAWSVTRLIASQLWGVAPTDPLTFAAAAGLLAIAAVTAAFLPIRSACTSAPQVVLRCE